MATLKSNLEPRGVRVDPARFEAIVRAHEAFAAGRPGGARALPRHIVAHGMRCDRRVLTDVDFTGADLTGSVFALTDFSRASFYCANLSKCDLRGARLIRADLRGAAFTGARLTGANLDEADLRAAVLCTADELQGLRWVGARANMSGAKLDGASLTEANAFSVDFTNCSMRGVRLRFANLKNANFTDANLDGADFAGAQLRGARLHGAILTGVDVASLGLPAAALAGCLLEPDAKALDRLGDICRELDRAHLWVATNGAEGAPAMLDGFDLRPAKSLFRKQMLVGLKARQAIGVGMDFTGSQLQGAVFDGADLRGADFTRADLRGVSFRNAKLAHAVFEDADFAPLPLSRGAERPTCFDGASLEGTGIAFAPRAEAGAFIDI